MSIVHIIPVVSHLKIYNIGVMQWDDCNALFDTLISNPADDWYLYDTTAVLPVATMLFNRDTWERA
jgi:hypothetical protein